MLTYVLLAMVGIPTPRPPTLAGCPPYVPVIDKVIETAPAVFAQDDDQPGRVLLPNGTAEYTFKSMPECMDPLPAVAPEDPANFAREPLFCDAAGADPEFCIEPGYDEHGPGPQEGPPGAGTVDKPG
jgi:hypothetical protein